MFRKLITSTALVVALGGVAVAADLPSRSPPPVYVPPPAFTWTGFYIGGQVGYQFGTEHTSLFANVPGLPFAAGVPGYNMNGVVGGAHMGLQAQFSQFVLGVEGDIEGASVRGSTVFAGVTGSSREDVESTYRLRAGYAFDRVLLYATGGLAIADFNNSYNNGLPGGLDSFNHTRFGWTGGGGIEYAITNNWSIRAEYRYTEFGATNDTLLNSTGGAVQARVRETDNSVRGGFSYKFGAPPPPPPPLVAKY
jgi:outer membrane immunogenic protein